MLIQLMLYADRVQLFVDKVSPNKQVGAFN